jgi:hypothetical protein
MNSDIYNTIKEKKQAYCKWKWNGKPQNPLDQLVINKKLTSYNLRRFCRTEVAQIRIKERQELIEAKTMDNKLVHKQRGKLNRVIDELHVSDSVFKTDTEILIGWGNHFANLAKESDRMDFDHSYLDTVDIEYKHIIKICQHDFIHETVSKEELGKSSDICDVTPECIAYEGEKLRNVLLNLINTSFEHCLLPDLLKIRTLTPIFKNKGMIIDAKNYRGITITPTLSKIVETIIKFRINLTIVSVQNPLQRGFTEHSTPLISSLMLEEVGRENKDNKEPTIIGMLDAKSAFDVVRHANLIRRLYLYGITKQCILMIDDLYRNATTKIKWKGEFSEGFKIEQGVRQGATLSAACTKYM